MDQHDRRAWRQHHARGDDLAGHQVHSRRADEGGDEARRRQAIDLRRRADLFDAASVASWARAFLNLIEALAVGAPVVVGPSMFNFAEATRLAVEAGAAVQASDAGSAIRTALGLIADQSRRRRMGEAGKKLCEAHRGATERHLKRGLSLIRS